MKHSIPLDFGGLILLLIPVMQCSAWNAIRQSHDEVAQTDNAVTHSKTSASIIADSMETQCMNRVNEFLKWYIRFSIDDETARHPIKYVLVSDKKVWHVDTVNVVADIERYYKTGFFTKSWRKNAISEILAADTLLNGLIADQESDFEDSDLGLVKGLTLTSDPVLGLGGHRAWFDSTYILGNTFEWKINGFETTRKGVFSIDLFLYKGIPGANKWTLQLVFDNGKLKIDKVSGITRVE